MTTKNKSLYLILALLTLALFHPATASANVVWPALYLETRLVTWWAIGLGLIIELIFLALWFDFTLKKAIVADVTMNVVSTLLGIILVPLSGILWELIFGIAFYKILGVGTFNPITWTATFILAVTVNATLEKYALEKAFRVDFDKRRFYLLATANSLSVGVAFLSMYFYPVRM